MHVTVPAEIVTVPVGADAAVTDTFTTVRPSTLSARVEARYAMCVGSVGMLKEYALLESTATQVLALGHDTP